MRTRGVHTLFVKPAKHHHPRPTMEWSETFRPETGVRSLSLSRSLSVRIIIVIPDRAGARLPIKHGRTVRVRISKLVNQNRICIRKMEEKMF